MTSSIVPSEGLKEEWESEWHHYRGQNTYEEFMARQAAQWGADQELAAIFEMVGQQSLPEEDRYLDGLTVASIRAARRPKARSEADQALDQLKCIDADLRKQGIINTDKIRRALERLKELEALPND